MLKSHISETFVKRLVQKYQDKGLTFACKLLIEYSLLINYRQIWSFDMSRLIQITATGFLLLGLSANISAEEINMPTAEPMEEPKRVLSSITRTRHVDGNGTEAFW